MSEKTKKDSVFATLNAINVNEHTEQKPTGFNSKSLTYLSWPWGWAEVKKRYPDASYTIYRDEQNRPYIEDPDFGLMCMTTVTIEGQTHEMWLPVMDASNKAMKRVPYTYKVWNRNQNKWEEKTVVAATMFDINKTIMRCLVKNLAMFGLGLYIYAGEDLPETEEKTQSVEPKTRKAVDTVNKPNNKSVEEVLDDIKKANTKEELALIFNSNLGLQSDKDFISALTTRKNQILNGTTAA